MKIRILTFFIFCFCSISLVRAADVIYTESELDLNSPSGLGKAREVSRSHIENIIASGVYRSRDIRVPYTTHNTVPGPTTYELRVKIFGNFNDLYIRGGSEEIQCMKTSFDKDLLEFISVPKEKLSWTALIPSNAGWIINSAKFKFKNIEGLFSTPNLCGALKIAEAMANAKIEED